MVRNPGLLIGVEAFALDEKEKKIINIMTSAIRNYKIYSDSGSR